MKRKILLSPLIIVILIIVVGVGAVGAAILIGGGGGSSEEVSLQKGLVGQWKFDGNAKDSTPSSNNGTVTGVTLTTDRKGTANRAYSFNGSSDFVNVPHNANLNLTTAITISAWINIDPAGKADYQTILTKQDGVADPELYMFRLQQSSGFLLGRIQNAAYAVNDITGSADLTGAWHHVVFTYDANFLNIYVDGVSAATPVAKTITPGTNTAALTIGKTLTAGRFAKGTIDDVRIYNRALSQVEITALYQSYDPGIQVSDLQKGLVGQWKMDGNAKDSTPNSNHGTVTGATLTTDRKGQANKAYSFNGSTDYIDAGDTNSDVTTAGVSVTAWVKFTSDAAGVDYGIVSKKTGFTDASGYFLIYENNQLYFNVGFSGGYRELAGGASGANLGTGWKHVVGTTDGTNMYIYVDGVQTNTRSDTNANIAANAQTLRIGETGFGARYWLNGSIDDARVYNRALSQVEITALYQSYDPGIQVSDLQKGLVGQWKMDGNAKDSTPYGNNGTVTGATLTTDRKGQANKAYSFNGTSDYVDAGNGDSLKNITTAVTVEVWAKRTAAVAWHSIVSKNTTSSDRDSYRLMSDPSGIPSIDIFGNTAVGSAMTQDVWYHLVGTWDKNDSGTIRFYQDGILKNTGTYAGNLDATTVNLSIGRDNDGALFFPGLIDDVRIYNRALSATEITALYESY